MVIEAALESVEYPRISTLQKSPGSRLGLIKTRDMRRYEEMEIKQGRIAMLATLHVIVTEAGIRRPSPTNHPDWANRQQTFSIQKAASPRQTLTPPPPRGHHLDSSSWRELGVC